MRTIEVLPGIFQITPFHYVNLLLIAKERLSLIDTGVFLSAGIILSFIRQLKRDAAEIDLIIITHNHFDHISGLPEIRKHTKARVAAHVADLNEAHPSYPGRVIPRLLGLSLLSPCRRYIYLKRDDVDIPLEGGEILDVLGGLEVIHTPGHTPGSISLYSRKEGLIVVSDALAKHRGRIDPPVKRNCLDFPQAMRSVAKLTQYNFNTICFGHGLPISGNVAPRVRQLVSAYP